MADNGKFITNQGEFTGGVIKGADGDDVAMVDYSAGVSSISGESASDVVASAVRVKFNLNAEGEPGAGDDASAGYSTGSLWLQPRPDGKMWICVDPAEGDARWIRYVDHSGGEGVQGYINDYMAGADFGSGNDVSTIRVVNVNSTGENYPILTAASSRVQGPFYQKDVQVTRHNFGSSRAPTPYDDKSQGYLVGALWVWMDDGTETMYVCSDDTVGAAVWVKLEDGDSSDTLYVLCRDRGDFEQYVSFHRSAETAKAYEALREKDEFDWGGDPNDPEVRKYNYYEAGTWRFVEPKEIAPGVWSPPEAYWTDDCGHAVRTVAIRD